MEKTIKAGKKAIRLTNRVKWMVIYKQQFGKDILPTLIPIANTVIEVAVGAMKATGGKGIDMKNAGEVLKDIDVADVQSAMYSLAGLEFTDLLQIVWSMEKALDDNAEDFDAWVESVEAFPVDAILPAVIDLNAKMLMTSKNYSRLRSAVDGLKSATSLSTSTES